jgi:hypothetical protein
MAESKPTLNTPIYINAVEFALLSLDESNCLLEDGCLLGCSAL